MNGRRVSYVFLFFTVAMTIADDDDLETLPETPEVSIKDTTVTLTCPYSQDIKWFNNKVELPNKDKIYSIDNYYDKNDNWYYCKQSDGNPHYFFIKAKVCKHCVDLNMNMALLVVFADVLFTLGIVFLVYYCSRKKTGTATPQRSTETRHPRPQTRGPPPPDRDYQPLNLATRNNDVYATANH